MFLIDEGLQTFVRGDCIQYVTYHATKKVIDNKIVDDGESVYWFSAHLLNGDNVGLCRYVGEAVIAQQIIRSIADALEGDKDLYLTHDIPRSFYKPGCLALDSDGIAREKEPFWSKASVADGKQKTRAELAKNAAQYLQKVANADEQTLRDNCVILGAANLLLEYADEDEQA